MIDREHQKKFEKVWDRGNYRQGSTAQRLVHRLLDIIPEGATINDYGSGTGRMELEFIQKRPDARINMIDIAANALEPACRELMQQKAGALTFTLADLADLNGVPLADWGICINVLMIVQPDKLDTILREIRRTCNNLFFEAYDMDDVRCGHNMTTVKLNGDQWHERLSTYWPDITIAKSPESNRRYILICRSSLSAMACQEPNK